MSLPIILRPQAEADLKDARDWYATQSPGLEIAFAESVDHVLERIAAMPQKYAVVFRDLRRGKLRRFPYVIYYRVLSDRSRLSLSFTGVAIPNSGKNVN